MSVQVYGPLPIQDPHNDEQDDLEAAVLHYNQLTKKNHNHDNDVSTSMSNSLWDDPSSPSDLVIFEIGTIDCDDDDDDQRDDGSTSTPTMSCHCPSSSSHHPTRLLLPTTSYYCPLTLNLMKDPVLDRCGHCFDREAILPWLSQHECCPISRKPLHPNDLMDAVALKERIEQWKEGHVTTNANATSAGSGSREHNEGSRIQSDSSSHTSSYYSPLELMLLPQERKVLSMIKFQEQVQRQRERFSRCAWAVVYAVTLTLFSVAFAAIYSFNVTIRAPL